MARFEDSGCKNETIKSDLESALSSASISRGCDGACWFDFDIPGRQKTTAQKDIILNKQFAKSISEECGTDFQTAALEISHRSSSESSTNLEAIIKQLIPWSSVPRPLKVEAIRRITSEANPNRNEISGGEGLTKELRRLKMPTVEEQFVSQEKWARFENFVRSILNDPDAEVTTDAEATAVLVKSGTPGFLELSDLGTGIEEIIMIAAVAACNDDRLIIIEEPEIHLHPTLQSKLRC